MRRMKGQDDSKLCRLRVRFEPGALFGLLLMVLLSSVATAQLPVDYGSRRGAQGSSSLNGVAGFAKIYESLGCEVQSWSKLSPRIENFETIVWFPGSRRLPTDEERERLEAWLNKGWSRTLVVVLNDYSAERDYLEAALPNVDPLSAEAYRRRLSDAIASDLVSRAAENERHFDGWVVREPGRGRRVASRITGDLAAGLGNLPTHLVTDRTLAIPTSTDLSNVDDMIYETWLYADRRRFVVSSLRSVGSEGRVVVVANGSFLVNYGLTFDGNRYLAEELAASTCDYGPVLFLESNELPLRVTDQEESGQPMIWDWMSEWPFAFLMTHLLFVSVLVYFVYVPIFGRPRKLLAPSTSDFGRHVAAVGDLLDRSGDRDRATSDLKHYHEQVRHDSGGLGVAAGPRRSKPRETS